MDSVIDFLYQAKDFLNPKYLIDYMLNLLGGYVYFGLWFIIFAETGLAVGFFLPGDSLLVVAGLFAAAEKLNVWLVMLAFFLGSVIGDSTGYWTGRWMGKTLFNRESSWIFKPSRVEKAHAFFEKYGVKTVILARFVPIVRTFAPLVVGAQAFFELLQILFGFLDGVLADLRARQGLDRVLHHLKNRANFRALGSDGIFHVALATGVLHHLQLLHQLVVAALKHLALGRVLHVVVGQELLRFFEHLFGARGFELGERLFGVIEQRHDAV